MSTTTRDDREAAMSLSDVRILMLGEDYDPVEGLRVTLIKAGYAVHAARCGEEGLEDLLLWNPDVILLDLSVPGLGGVAFCRLLRKLSAAQIIAFSAKKDQTTLVETLDAGADDFVWKPFSLAAVQARIRACVRRRARELRAVHAN